LITMREVADALLGSAESSPVITPIEVPATGA
jgi:hypothetical protein